MYDLVERAEEPVPDPRRRSGAKRSRGEDASPRKGDTGAVDPTITVGPGTVSVTYNCATNLDCTCIFESPRDLFEIYVLNWTIFRMACREFILYYKMLDVDCIN